MEKVEREYWLKKAAAHRKAAATFSAKFKRTGEIRWKRQAETNAVRAAGIERQVG